MPAPQYILPQSLQPLQLYRHLLREASYLPPAFRKTIGATIRTRFRNNRKDVQLTKKRISGAMSSLRTLRAANSGDKAAMERLAMKGFGRMGNRRRELMSQLVKPQGPGDTQTMESILGQLDQVTAASAASASASEPQPGKLNPSTTDQPSQKTKAQKPKNSFFERWDQPKLLQIVRSQKQQQKYTKGTASWPGQSVKVIDPDQYVPQTNIWGKPPAESLVRTKRSHWWRRNADKIMPPLGKGEWDLLRQLSLGAQQDGEWAVPSRRIYPSTRLVSQTEVSGQWDWEAQATTPTARLELPKVMSLQRRTGQYDAGPYGGRPRSKETSSRWFRRLYNRIWQITPNMEQDPNTLQYKITWGTVMPNVPSATASQMNIFDGVDSKGNKLR